MIKAVNLNFSYGMVSVLQNINIQWNCGNFISIIGENGSGKSTLIKCLSGFLNVDHSNIELKGAPINSLSLAERSRIIAYVPQRASFEKTTIVYDFILSGRKPWFFWKEGKHDRDLVFEVMDKFSIRNIALKRMDELSGGERQKVVIAKAIVQETPVIFLDEPTNNLDIRFQIELMEILKKEVSVKNKLIIMAIHDINLAMRYTSEALILKDGKIISGGTIEDAINENSIKTAMNINNEIISHKGIKIMIPHVISR